MENVIIAAFKVLFYTIVISRIPHFLTFPSKYNCNSGKLNVKTEKLIGRTSRDLKEKPIKRSMGEAKTIINLTKIDKIQ